MPRVERKDIFHIASDAPATGFVILRKDCAQPANPYLDQLIITSDTPTPAIDAQHSVWGIICDTVLYEAIEDGDIGMMSAKGNIRVILSRRANHNTVLVTERCDNRCVFCSQPPKEADDDWLFIQSAMAIAAFNSTDTIGISGGEPLLYQDSFLRFLDFIIAYSPQTPLHILSNGRAFSDSSFAQAVASRCKSLTVTFGIPLYAPMADIHDTLVGAPGAFRDTFLGLINAGNSGISIEVRYIPTRTNNHLIAETIELVGRCISSVGQVSIMNLEPIGWAKQNWDSVYSEPRTYQNELEQSIESAERAGIPVALFNYPRCHIPTTLWPYAVKSISDWKNYYPDVCTHCVQKSQCSGYFSSSKGKVHQPPRIIQ